MQLVAGILDDCKVDDKNLYSDRGVFLSFICGVRILLYELEWGSGIDPGLFGQLCVVFNMYVSLV